MMEGRSNFRMNCDLTEKDQFHTGGGGRSETVREYLVDWKKDVQGDCRLVVGGLNGVRQGGNPPTWEERVGKENGLGRRGGPGKNLSIVGG